ncbi:hypothetical protein JCM1840_005207 [Sporobolomyces johnsonii]
MDPQDRIAALLRQIDTLSTRTSNVKDELRQVLDDLVPLAQEHGLHQGNVEKGYELALGGHLVPQHALLLLSALIPKTPLSPRPILSILSSLGEAAHNRPLHAGQVEYKVQKRMLEQLAVLLELGSVSNEAREVLERLYGVVERGLDYRVLRESTAALMCSITRRHHVQEHRIAHVQRILRLAESPPASLFRLLELYRSFCPESVFQLSTPTQIPTRSGWGVPLEEWRISVKAALEQGEGETSAKFEGREAKRRKVSMQTAIPLPTTDSAGTNVTSLSNLSSLDPLAHRLDFLTLPSQAASALSSVPGSSAPSLPRSEEDRTKAWAILLRCGYGNDPEQLKRLTTWILHQLSHELCDVGESPGREARVEDLLCRVRELSEMGGELFAEFESFLADYLRSWDGKAHTQVVFGLIALHKPVAYEGFFGNILRPLFRLASAADPEWTADCIACLTELVSNFAVRDDWNGPGSATAFGALDAQAPDLDSLQSVLDFVDRLIAVATLKHPTSLLIRTSALTFYETALTLPLEHGLPVVVLPTPAFTYLSLLSTEAMSVSRICGIIATLREALTGESTAISKTDPSNTDLVNALNLRLVDFVNTLWQKRFLTPTAGGDGGAMGLTAEQLQTLRQVAERRGQAPGSSVGLTTHGALATLARDCLQALASQQDKSAASLVGPVTASSLKLLARDATGLDLPFAEFRPSFLEYLQVHGAEGVHDFLFSSLQSLINRRQSQSQSQV